MPSVTRRVVRRWRIGGSYTFLMARRRAKASFKRADALLRQDALPDAATRWLYQFEFLDWTGEHHLRHTTFIGLRD